MTPSEPDQSCVNAIRFLSVDMVEGIPAVGQLISQGIDVRIVVCAISQAP